MERKEALEVVRKNMPTDRSLPVYEALQTLIPELMESEDERIRKELLDAVDKARVFDIDKDVADRWTAWLEKQKEQKPLSPDEKMNHSLYLEGFDVGREVGKVEAEQKPEDRFKEAREKYQVEWSEEDEKMRNLIVAIFEVNHPDGFFKVNELGTTDMRGVHTEEIISWLKSLRPSWQITYRQIVHSIFKMLKGKDFYGMPSSSCVSLLNDIRVKCKDADECAEILAEPSWKPSEEQMAALSEAVSTFDGYEESDAIKSLYNQLKKLV